MLWRWLTQTAVEYAPCHSQRLARRMESAHGAVRDDGEKVL